MTAPPITLEEVLFSGLVSRVHKENRALKAKNEALVEKALEARREKDKAVAALESSKKSMQDQIDALEAKNAKLKMRLKNADALLSKTELWFDAYVKLSKEATIRYAATSGTSIADIPAMAFRVRALAKPRRHYRRASRAAHRQTAMPRTQATGPTAMAMGEMGATRALRSLRPRRQSPTDIQASPTDIQASWRSKSRHCPAPPGRPGLMNE